MFIAINSFLVVKMKEEVFYGKGMERVKSDEPELYQAIVALNEAVWNGKVLDYKTQKLIAIAISATNHESSAFIFIITSNIFTHTVIPRTIPETKHGFFP